MSLDKFIEAIATLLVGVSALASIVLQFLTEEQINTPIGGTIYRLAHFRPPAHAGTFKLPGVGPADPSAEAAELEARLAELRQRPSSPTSAPPSSPSTSGESGRASFAALVLLAGFVLGGASLRCKSFDLLRGAPDGCENGTFRCAPAQGDVAESPWVCSEHYWMRIGDLACAEVEHQVCGYVRGAATCVPPNFDGGTDLDAGAPTLADATLSTEAPDGGADHD